MKPAVLVSGALTIAAVSAAGGYFLGKNQTAPASGHTAAMAGGGAAKPSAGRALPSPKTDVAKLRAELDREKDPLARYNLAIRNLEAWVNADPKSALEWLSAQPATGRRAETLRMVLGQYAENDPKGAAGWALENLTGVDLNNALIRIAEEWARRDGLEAANWLSSLPAGSERDAALEGMFFVWASRDPAAAVDFIKRNPAPDALSATLRYAAYAGWAKTDPQGAVAASLESSRVYQDPEQFANTLANWATADLTASSAWLLANVRDGDFRASAVRELATLFAHQSPDAGLTWIGKLNAGGERDMAVNQLASEWAAADPAAAAKWAAGQTQGNLTDASVSEIIHIFAAKDEAAFDAWRATLPEGPMKAAAAKLAAAEDPAE